MRGVSILQHLEWPQLVDTDRSYPGFYNVQNLRFNEYRSRAWTSCFVNAQFKKISIIHWGFNPTHTSSGCGNALVVSGIHG